MADLTTKMAAEILRELVRDAVMEGKITVNTGRDLMVFLDLFDGRMPNRSIHDLHTDRAAIADLIRPALNEYPDGTLRVSKGQGDVAETVVQIVWQAMEANRRGRFEDTT